MPTNDKIQTQSIDTLLELKKSSNQLFSGAKKLIQIYSQGLDPRVLNNRDIERQLMLFIKKSRYCKVQILIFDENLLKGIDHRLVSLAQRFTSNIEIRVIAKEHQDNMFGFYLSDQCSMLYRSNVERYGAENLKMPNLKIKGKLKLFNNSWQSSSPASFLRVLHL